MKRTPLLAIFAVLLISGALWQLHAGKSGVVVTSVDLEGTPVQTFVPAAAQRGPAVVIAHGFAGSQQLMQGFALTLARNGYIAVTFDFPGHGRNPRALTGSITEVNGATQTLLKTLTQVGAYARGLGDGRLAVLGHSMASDIVVRYAESTPEVAATIAVSMFSPAVTATAPRNLLVIVGDWEPTLKREALRAIGLSTAPTTPLPGITYGEVEKGTARRVAFSAHVEHASVLFSQDSMRESAAWLDQAFGVARAGRPRLDERGPWILLLLTGIVLLARPLSRLLPQLASPAVGAALSWRELALPVVLPMFATPLLLRVLPTHFLPVIVGDYLAVHFATYGLLTALCLRWKRRGQAASQVLPKSRVGLLVAAAAMIGYGLFALAWPIDQFITSFVPGPGRLLLLLAMGVGTLAFFLSDEWLTRGQGSARGAYVVSKLAFLASLGGAIALDFERLFFLIIIVPIMLLFFLIYGLFSTWAYRRTGHPFVAGIANAFAFAWAIAVTFPLVAR